MDHNASVNGGALPVLYGHQPLLQQHMIPELPKYGDNLAHRSTHQPARIPPRAWKFVGKEARNGPMV